MFSVDSAPLEVGARASAAVTVRCEAPAGAAGPAPSGKVVLTCPSEPALPPWVFFVRGEAPPAGAEAGSAGVAAGKGAKGKAKKR